MAKHCSNNNNNKGRLFRTRTNTIFYNDYNEYIHTCQSCLMGM